MPEGRDARGHGSYRSRGHRKIGKRASASTQRFAVEWIGSFGLVGVGFENGPARPVKCYDIVNVNVRCELSIIGGVILRTEDLVTVIFRGVLLIL